MSGISLILDLMRKNPDFCSRNLHSYGSFSAKVAVSAAAASAAASYPFAFRPFISNSDIPAAHCDAAPTWSDDLIPSAQYPPGFVVDAHKKYMPKVYIIEPKPLLSAFHWKALSMTTLRSVLMFYLPLLEPRPHPDEEDDEEILQDSSKKNHVDLVTPFNKSVVQIARESAVVTTRRVLERLCITYVSQRMAWKLLKDAPRSAVRKAQRGMPKTVYIYCVTKTTLRSHCLGVAASWIVQVGIELYRTLSNLFGANDELEEVDRKQEFQILGWRIFGATVRCSSSLVFASIGAGVGAALIRPSMGQWIGCALGDLAGPIVITACFDRFLHVEL